MTSVNACENAANPRLGKISDTLASVRLREIYYIKSAAGPTFR